mmetsp:Transcript_60547/g.179461  ORF Transcript_60547/g.179461 Transcript_60547/m.179461 type:complete len:120 (-) Transcript_60547:397-756(-)
MAVDSFRLLCLQSELTSSPYKEDSPSEKQNKSILEGIPLTVELTRQWPKKCPVIQLRASWRYPILETIGRTIVLTAAPNKNKTTASCGFLCSISFQKLFEFAFNPLLIQPLWIVFCCSF